MAISMGKKSHWKNGTFSKIQGLNGGIYFGGNVVELGGEGGSELLRHAAIDDVGGLFYVAPMDGLKHQAIGQTAGDLH